MPIYAYRCTGCGHAKDVLQKISDAPLSVCPACGASSFVKQLTAAGFQLKGSGWYVTDFRGGKQGASKPEGKAGEGASDGSAAKSGDKPAADKPSAAAGTAADKGTSSSSAPAPAKPPAAPPGSGK